MRDRHVHGVVYQIGLEKADTVPRLMEDSSRYHPAFVRARVPDPHRRCIEHIVNSMTGVCPRAVVSAAEA
jgi:hypothetical protein